MKRAIAALALFVLSLMAPAFTPTVEAHHRPGHKCPHGLAKQGRC